MEARPHAKVGAPATPCRILSIMASLCPEQQCQLGCIGTGLPSNSQGYACSRPGFNASFCGERGANPDEHPTSRRKSRLA